MADGKRRGLLSGEEGRWRDQFARRVDDLAQGESCDTPFLDPFQLELAGEVLKERPHLSHVISGGYPRAERVRLHVFFREKHGAPPPVQALRITGPLAAQHLSPRDLLGALLGLGLKRDQIGDVFSLPGENEAAAMIIPAMTGYVCTRLSTVGGCSVSCTAVDAAGLPLPGPCGREISGTVAGMRLDAVLALGFGLSRSRAAALVKAGLARIDWRAVESPASAVGPGQTISLGGRGRLEVVSLDGETRKGRLRLTLKKFS